MKKFLGILVLGLLWCSNSFGETADAWKIDNKYLTPKCFVYEWMSSDNFKAFHNKYSPEKVKFTSPKWDDWWNNIGLYFGKEIPLEDSFEVWWGENTLSLTRYLKDCTSSKPITEDKEKLLSYEVSGTMPKGSCKILAPNVSAKCLDIKIIRFTQAFTGSMPPKSQNNIYGIYELDNEKIILPLAFDVVVEKKEKKEIKVLRKDFFSWLSSQKEYSNTNQLLWDEDFRIYIDQTIPKIEVLLGFSKRKKTLLKYNFKNVIGGPPDKLVYSEDRRYLLASACRPRECPSKGLIWFDTKDEKSIGLIRHSFWDELDFSKYEDNQILIFSSDYLELPSEFVNSVSAWMKKNEIVPTKVRFIGPDNTIKEIKSNFKN